VSGDVAVSQWSQPAALCAPLACQCHSTVSSSLSLSLSLSLSVSVSHTRIALSFSTDRVNAEYADELKAQFLTGISLGLGLGLTLTLTISWGICRMARSSHSAQRNTCYLSFLCRPQIGYPAWPRFASRGQSKLVMFRYLL